jgi:hypothetical protein
MRLSQEIPSRAARVMFTILMALAWAGGADPARTGAAATQPTIEPKQLVEKLQRVYRAMHALDGESPRDSFDLRAVVAKAGRDPGQLLKWVSDNTYWVPYQGALRGPLGVLMDRVGSGLDRAMLLAALVHEAGYSVRLAHRDLPAPAATTLLGKVRPLPARPFSISLRPQAQIDRFINDYSTRYQLDPAGMRRHSEENQVELARNSEDLLGRVATQTAELAKLVPAPPAEPPPAGVPEKTLASIRDYWWVQYDSQSQWLDLDPLQGGPGAPQETIPYDGSLTKLPLSPAQCHEVQVRVVIERCVDGKLTELPALTQTFRPAELGGQSVTLANTPIPFPSVEKLISQPKPEPAFREAVLNVNEWVPALTLGDSPVWQNGFTVAGEIDTSPPLNMIGGVNKGPTAAGSKALDAFGGGPATHAANPGQATAQWIDYEIRSPGQPVRHERREVFDLIGPAARATGEASSFATLSEAQRLDRGLALFGSVEILCLGYQLSSAFLSHQATDAMAANAERFTRIVGHPESLNQPGQMASLAPTQTPPGILHQLALVRGTCNRLAGDIYLDTPNVFSLHTYARLNNAGHLQGEADIDIVVNNVAMRRGAAASPFATSFEQGVFDTNAEAIVARSLGSDMAGNASDAYEGSDPSDWTALRDAGQGARVDAVLPQDDAVRVGQALNAGQIIIAPARALAFGGQKLGCWWRVDPHTGNTLGIGRHGWGESPMVSYALLFRAIVTPAMMTILCLLAACVALTVGAMTPGWGVAIFLLCVAAAFCAFWSGAFALGTMEEDAAMAVLWGLAADIFGMAGSVVSIFSMLPSPKPAAPAPSPPTPQPQPQPQPQPTPQRQGTDGGK